MSLASTPDRARVRVTGVRPGNPLSFRLMEMGLINGAEIEVVRRAPLGDPMHVRVGDYQVALRHAEADLVDVAAIG